MNSTVTDALRRAASLTRAGKPFEATRAIRAALMGPSAEATSERDAAGPAGRAPLAAPILLDLTANGREPAPPADDPAAAGTAPADTLLRRGAARFARPLAATIRDLSALRRASGPQPLAGAPPVPAGARALSRTFDGPHGRRDYRLYIPAAAANGRPAGLVMMLHGCKQDPDDFATGTGMNLQADAAGMIVVYPAQSAAANPSRCWNWFNAADQRRGAGEAALLAALAGSVASEFGVAPGAVFVAGLSAGGAMAAILADAYPDVFAAAGIHSGLPAGAASDMPSAFAAMAGHGVTAASAPTRAAETPLIVFHGTADAVVRPVNAEALVEHARRRAHTVDRLDGTAGGRRYQRVIYRAAHRRVEAEHWILDGHGHAWAGGRPEGSYTDQTGPDASAEMMRFFLEAAGSARA